MTIAREHVRDAQRAIEALDRLVEKYDAEGIYDHEGGRIDD
jgi:hypothetical protein